MRTVAEEEAFRSARDDKGAGAVRKSNDEELPAEFQSTKDVHEEIIDGVPTSCGHLGGQLALLIELDQDVANLVVLNRGCMRSRSTLLRAFVARDRVRALYKGKLVGNSPELCRALDSHGFADLKNAIDVNRALTCTSFAVGDPRRFEMGTPSQVFSTMSRCWEVAPSSARVIEDIEALPRVVEKILAYKGCVVPDEFLRDGRRREKKMVTMRSTRRAVANGRRQ